MKEEEKTVKSDDTIRYDEFGDYNELRCDVCGMLYSEFLETGVFGCENCYRVFKSQTVQLLKLRMKKRKKLSKNEEEIRTKKKEKEIEDTFQNIKNQNFQKLNAKEFEKKELRKLKECLKDYEEKKEYKRAKEIKEKISQIEKKGLEK